VWAEEEIEMKTILSIAIILLLAPVIFGQKTGTVSGIVYQDQKPVAGAKVVLYDGLTNNFKAQTDATGFYKFESVPIGGYQLTAEKEAGKGMAFIVVTIKRGVSLTQDLQLSMANYAPHGAAMSPIRETVTVSADQPQPIDEVSKTVNVIDAQEMRDRADFTLVDTLRSVPGFRVQQLGGFGRTANIKTRGLRNQDTAVLIDGIRFRDASSITGDASPFLSDFTLTSVSKVEVLRGSGSSLYGTNAIGGVIDFQTPDPQQGWHGQFSSAFGGMGLSRWRGNISNATDDGKFGFNAAISRTVYTKGIDGDDNANNVNFQSKLIFQPTSKTTVSGRFFVSDAFVRLNSDPDVVSAGVPASTSVIVQAIPDVTFIPDADDPDNIQRSKFFDGQGSITYIFNSHLVFQGYYSGVWTSRKNENGELGPGFQFPSKSVFEGTIQTANGHVNWSNSINAVTAGYEFEHEKFGNDGFTPDASGNFVTRAFQSSHTVYAQDLVSLLDGRLQLAGGVRVQFFDLGKPTFQPISSAFSAVPLQNPPTAYTFDCAVSYFFHQTGTKIRAHVGNGYRVPSLFERFATFFNEFDEPPSFVVEGDPSLKPERSIAADGGLEQAFFADKVRLTAIYFYTKLIDTIGFGNVVPDIGTTPRPFGGYMNQKGGIARGTEFSGRVRPTDTTDIFASYTFTNSDQRQPQISGSGVIETLGIPKHQFTLVATQRIQRFWVNFDLLVASSYLAPIFESNFPFRAFVFQFQGNRRGDLTAGYTFGWKQEKLNLRIFGTIENIFDQKYFENGFRTPGQTGRVGLSFGF
jgi:iron complex outermembrane receptor protein